MSRTIHREPWMDYLDVPMGTRKISRQAKKSVRKLRDTDVPERWVRPWRVHKKKLHGQGG